MKSVTNTISALFTCDACDIESETTSGSLPSGWVEFSKKAESLGDIDIKHQIGPTCLASDDLEVLEAIRNLLS